MREICFILIGSHILRAYVGTRTTVPDERERWNAIWENRDEITEIVHTHPGGFLGFSSEDLSTMEAVEAATGNSYTWSIVTEEGYLTRYEDTDNQPEGRPWWLPFLRQMSFNNQRNPNTITKEPCQLY